MSVMYIRDKDGNLVPVRTIHGEKGEKGDPGAAGPAGAPGADGVSPTVAVSKTGNTTTITITDKNGAKTATIQDGEDGSGGSAAGAEQIPGYWQAALDNGVAAINTEMEAAGREKSAFLWYTDAHWGYGSGMSPKLLGYLHQHTAMNKINFGGDFSNNYEEPDTGKTPDDWLNVMRDFRLAVRNLPNHHSVIGNHDANGGNGEMPYLNGQPKHLYGFAMAPEETPDIVRGGSFYYYIDDPSEKTRYLYLNTSFCWSLENTGEAGQGQFAAEALATTPDGWHIVVLSHIWFLYASTSTPTVGNVPTYCQQLLGLFDAYNSRSSGSAVIGTETVSYDFSGKNGRVEFCIGGHIHVDHDFTSSGGIPVILTETDSKHLRSKTLSYTAGTDTEASVSGIVADYDNRKVSVVRVGRGVSRTVALNGDTSSGGGGTSGETTYTNVLKTVGYMKNTRISASGGYAEKEESGVDLTGYIPIKFADVLRFKNMTIPQTSASGYDNEIYLFDENKTGTGSDDLTNLIGTASWRGVWEAGNLVELTYGGSAGFCRINATHIDDTSIITINEEIQ